MSSANGGNGEYSAYPGYPGYSGYSGYPGYPGYPLLGRSLNRYSRLFCVIVPRYSPLGSKTSPSFQGVQPIQLALVSNTYLSRLKAIHWPEELNRYLVITSRPKEGEERIRLFNIIERPLLGSDLLQPLVPSAVGVKHGFEQEPHGLAKVAAPPPGHADFALKGHAAHFYCFECAAG